MLVLSSWRDVVVALRAQPSSSIVRFPKGCLPHPLTFRMMVSVGMPEGQRADYRKVLPDGTGFHVKDFGTHYEAHLDAVDPSVDLLEQLRLDAPGAYVAGGVALGALLGSALGKTKDGTLVGAAVGGLVAALLAQNAAVRTTKT